MSKQHIICIALWLFGKRCGLHLIYLGRPLQALLWYLAGSAHCWIIDLVLISHYRKQLNSMSSETPNGDRQQHKTLSLLAFEVWYSMLVTELATQFLIEDGAQPGWIALAPIVTVPLGVWWTARMNHQGVSWQAALVSGVMSYGLYACLCATLVTQGGVVLELFFKTDQRKFLMPILTTIILNMWQYRTWLTGQCVRLVKLVVKLVLVLLLSAAIIFLILRPYYLTYTTRDTPNEDNSRHHYTHLPTMTEDEKVLRACEVLSIHPGVSEGRLTVVYRHLVRQWHPDKHRGQDSKDAATQKFIQIQEAYQYLSHKLTNSRGRRK